MKPQGIRDLSSSEDPGMVQLLFAAAQRAQSGCWGGWALLEGSLQHHKFRMSLSLHKEGDGQGDEDRDL